MMTVNDAERVAEINTISWQHAYQGIMDQNFLDSMDAKTKIPRWKNAITHNSPPMYRFVVEKDERIIGYACGLENRHLDLLPASDCEIQAIYIDPLEKRKGAGRHLLQYFMREMRSINKQRLCIWCLRDNHAARYFYQASGGKLSSAEKHFTLLGQSLPEVAYEFDL